MDVVGYVQRLWGVHMDMVRNRRSKGMDRCPLIEGCPLTDSGIVVGKKKRKRMWLRRGNNVTQCSDQMKALEQLLDTFRHGSEKPTKPNNWTLVSLQVKCQPKPRM
jgi:hypothetical protein